MNKQDTARIMKMIKAAYPNFDKNGNEEDIANLWAWRFKNVDVNAVFEAVGEYIDTDMSGFAPSVGQIKQIIANKAYKPIDPSDAWQQVLKALMDAGSYPQKAFDKLPAPVQRAVGSAATLRQWAMAPTSELESFTKQRFVNQLKDQTTAEVQANIVDPERALESKAQPALPEEKKPQADDFNPADHRPKDLIDSVPGAITKNPKIKKIFESWGVM
jgi:hypothetical protein